MQLGTEAVAYVTTRYDYEVQVGAAVSVSWPWAAYDPRCWWSCVNTGWLQLEAKPQKKGHIIPVPISPAGPISPAALGAV